MVWSKKKRSLREMLYGLFYPERFYKAVVMDWQPFLGFDGPSRRPTRNGEDPVWEGDVSPRFGGRPGARQRTVAERQRQEPVAGGGNPRRRTGRGGGARGRHRTNASAQGSSLQESNESLPGLQDISSDDVEGLGLKPHYNLRSRARLDQPKDLRRTAVSPKQPSKVGRNNSKASSRRNPIRDAQASTSSINHDNVMPERNLKATNCPGDVNNDSEQFADEFSEQSETTDVGELTEVNMGTNSSAVRAHKLQAIEQVSDEVDTLSEQVNELECAKKNREFLYLEEMLTKCLLRLDDVSTDGIEEIRKARKTVVERINRQLQNLEDKLKLNVHGIKSKSVLT